MRIVLRLIGIVAVLALAGCMIGTWVGVDAMQGFSYGLDDVSFHVGDFTALQKLAMGVALFATAVVLVVVGLVCVLIGLIVSAVSVIGSVVLGLVIATVVLSPLILTGLLVWWIVKPRPIQAPLAS
jgi:uncharacterized membrane-anchored protein